jgi:hypothetical protein
MQQLFRLLIFLNQPYMYGATNSPISRSTFLTVYTAFGTMHRHCCRRNSVGALYEKLYIQTKSAPEDGRICRPKHVRLI